MPLARSLVGPRFPRSWIGNMSQYYRGEVDRLPTMDALARSAPASNWDSELWRRSRACPRKEEASGSAMRDRIRVADERRQTRKAQLPEA